MKQIRSIIVDDEPAAVEVLSLLLEKHPEIEILGTANSVDKGIELIQESSPDLVFLDVEMPHKDGFELVRAFEQANFKIIFVTAHDRYGIQAIKCAALDYIMKPVLASELAEAIEKVKQHFDASNDRWHQLRSHIKGKAAIDRIIITSKKGFITLLLDEIVSIESTSGNYAFFHLLDNRQFLCTKPIGHYEELLQDLGFYRIHRSHIVNLKQVYSFDSTNKQLLTNNQRSLAIAARRIAAFKKEMDRFLSHS